MRPKFSGQKLRSKKGGGAAGISTSHVARDRYLSLPPIKNKIKLKKKIDERENVNEKNDGKIVQEGDKPPLKIKKN